MGGRRREGLEGVEGGLDRLGYGWDGTWGVRRSGACGRSGNLSVVGFARSLGWG